MSASMAKAQPPAPALRPTVSSALARFMSATATWAPSRANTIDIARPFLWIALHHEHQTSLAALKREPVAAIFGLSHVGVVHLTGAEAAMGMSIPIAWDNAHFELFTRAGVVALPSFGAHGARDQVALFMDIGTGLPLSF